MATKVEERGHYLLFEGKGRSGRPVTKLFVYGKFPIDVWVPFIHEEQIPSEFVETTLKVEGTAMRIGIDSQRKNEFDALVSRTEWFASLAKCVDEKRFLPTLAYLHQEVPKWRATEKRSFVERAPYTFECDEAGAIWIHFTSWDREGIRPLCVNLEEDFIYPTLEFSEEVAKRIMFLIGQEIPGLLPLFDLYPIGSRYQAKISFYDETLHECIYDETLHERTCKISLEERIKMAQQLLRGLSFLEERRWVHCGVVPSSIWLRHDRWFEVDAALAGFESIYPVDQLPPNLLSAKWKRFLPPEWTTNSPISHPFAIPIYQLGLCLQPLFQKDPSYLEIIDRMIAPNPADRPTAQQALALFEADRKEIFLASDEPTPPRNE